MLSAQSGAVHYQKAFFSAFLDDFSKYSYLAEATSFFCKFDIDYIIREQFFVVH